MPDTPDAWRKTEVFFAGAVALFTVVLGCVSLAQWCAMLQANETNREALVSVQRAYVFVAPVPTLKILKESTGVKATPAKTVEGYLFQFQYNNSGTTPPKEMRGYINWYAKPVTKGFTYPDQGNAQTIPLVIPPKGNLNGTPFLMSPELMKAVYKDGAPLYFYGWTRYRDVFKKTPEHVTKFCYSVNAMTDPIDATHDTVIALNLCPEHNCYDDECKD
ncbi:MAG: hypothetical protein ABSC63_09220 [Candidatus Binataceae bacterium]|jgi:hypothetical protein